MTVSLSSELISNTRFIIEYDQCVNKMLHRLLLNVSQNEIMHVVISHKILPL